MSQDIFADINPNDTSGNELADYLNDFKAALLSNCSGTSRPTELEIGGTWLDTTSDPIWYLKAYDGTDDIILITIDTTNNVASLPTATDLFTITKISADTAGPTLDLVKKRIANSGQVLGGDTVAVWQAKGYDNTGAVNIVARIKAVASQNFTSTVAGTDLIFEATDSGTNAIAEVFRLKNGLLGLGTTAPEDKLHVVGAGRFQRNADDTTPARISQRKKKATGTGQTTSGETFGVHEFNSTDEAGSEVLAAKIETISTENHSTTAHGTYMKYSVKKTGATSFSEIFRIGDLLTSKVGHVHELYMSALQLVDASTTGSGQSVASTNSILKVTNASLTSINNISSPTDGKLLVLINGTGNFITLTNNSGGTAANRIITGTGADITVLNSASVFLVYDSAASRWQVVGGSGGGAPQLYGSTGSPRSIVAATGIVSASSHMSTVAAEQIVFVVGSISGESDVSANPQIEAGTIIGQKMKIVGTSDSDFIKLESGNGLYLTGDWYSYNNQSLDVWWNGTVWTESGRNV